MNTGALLQVKDLVKQFGALRATDHVTLDVLPGEIHALIGPNGAGKTSLVAQLSGHLPSDSGQIFFDGHNVTAMPTHERVHRGLARSFQITRLFKSFTVLDNVSLSVQARSGNSFSFWRPVRSDKALTDQAMSVLQELGLQDRAHDSASELSHGEQRILELGLAVATRPKLLLLDEPMAGAGHFVDRARHGRGVPIGRPHIGAGQRRVGRHGLTRGHSAQPPGDCCLPG